jgi:uncharacterized delta-60 repeat protein
MIALKFPKHSLFVSFLFFLFFLSGCGGGSSSGASSPTTPPPTTTPPPATPITFTTQLEGTVDTSFGNNGLVTHDNAAGGFGADMGGALVRDSSGNIYTAGDSFNGSNLDMALWKYTSNGVLDVSFGNNGVVTHDSAASGNGDDTAQDMVIDSSGNLYIVGTSYNGTHNGNDMVIWKYTSSGVLDASFGNNGLVVQSNTAGGNGDDEGSSIALDSSGSIYVVGSSYNGTDHDMVLWKFTGNGAPDPSFGTNGLVIHDIDLDDRGTAFTFDNNGNIYVAGWRGTISNYISVIWKFSATGILDTSFGTNGVVLNNDVISEFGWAIGMDSNEDLYLVGGGSDSLDIMSADDHDMIIRKYSSSGEVDRTFGTDGMVRAMNAANKTSGDGNDFGYSLLIDGNDNLYISGQSDTGLDGVLPDGSDDLDLVIWKYDSNGNPDRSFSDDGVFTYDPSISGFGMAFDPNGFLYIAGVGCFNNMNADMAIWRIK